MPTWNLAPTTTSLIVRRDEEGLATDWLTWGLGNAQIRPINARVETAMSKPVFREAWGERRCVVPADGWYEWRLEQGRKQPYYFFRRDGQPLFFAGLWTEMTFCILTMAADGALGQIHLRRPLALSVREARPWIEASPPGVDSLIGCAVTSTEIQLHAVDFRVSSPKNDGPELIVESIKTVATSASGELDLFPNSR